MVSVCTLGGSTVILCEPDFPSLVAVIVTVPSLTALPTPDVDTTVALAGLLVVQETGRVTSTPLKSRSLAVYVPCSYCLMVLGPDTVTLLTGTSWGGLTAIVFNPFTSPDDAVMVTLPGFTPVTTPVC